MKMVIKIFVLAVLIVTGSVFNASAQRRYHKASSAKAYYGLKANKPQSKLEKKRKTNEYYKMQSQKKNHRMEPRDRKRFEPMTVKV